MKAKNIFMKGALALAAVSTLASCQNDFLIPEPLSFYEPSNTFNTESGLQAVLAMCDRHLRINYIWYDWRDQDSPLATDYMFSDYMVFGMTDTGSAFNDNFQKRTTPTGDGSKAGFIFSAFWNESYNGIKYANGVISNLPNVTGLPEEKRNAYLGRAYFHRAICYYALVFSFGDVPLVTEIITVPKQNYSSTAKEAIIKKMIEDLEFASEWVPYQRDMDMFGQVNKEACQHLLAKFYLADGRFADAEVLATDIINNSGHELMTEPFGTNTTTSQGEPKTWPITRNVIWDLHRPENMIGNMNKETILGIPNLSEQSFLGYPWMRVFVPFWNDGSYFKTPDGMQAVNRPSRKDGKYDPTTDWLRAVGRGIATYRPTYYTQHSMWCVNGVEDKEDLRHNSTVGNWVNMEDMTYNNPSSAYHGQHIRFAKDGAVPNADGSWNYDDIYTRDTIRSWFDFPHYKLYHVDRTREDNLGSTDCQGATLGASNNMYQFRLAETYLLRAEAKLYQGKGGEATADLNKLRERAKCSQFYKGAVNIGDIMNERGRELYMEEFRHMELVRVSMILANTGIADEWGNTYDKNTWDKQSGLDRTGGSYWYQRLMHYSYYNRGYTISSGKATAIDYKMDKHNLYWPIPQSAIDANKKGQLKQNFDYSGYDESVNVWQTWQEAVEDERRTE